MNRHNAPQHACSAQHTQPSPLWRRLTTCPCCGGRIRFNWWWVADVDTYFYCKRCGIKLAQVSFITVVVMIAYAIGEIYNIYQSLSANYINTQSIIIMWAVLYALFISVARVMLLFALFRIKFAKYFAASRQREDKPKPQSKPKEEYGENDGADWWKPFTP